MKGIVRIHAVLFVVLAWFAYVAPAHAQSSFGIRGGITADPDQGFVGGQIQSPGLTPMGNLSVRPGVDIGFGSSVTIVAGSFDVIYRATLPSSKWTPYFGGGPGVTYVHDDFQHRAHGVFNGLAGMQHDSGIFAELKIGSGTGPGLKATVGYILKRK